MIEFNDTQIYNDAESVGDVADAISDFRSRAGRNSYRRGIESGAEEELHKTVRPAVLRAARRHVGEHASEIDFIDVGWNGRQYSIVANVSSLIGSVLEPCSRIPCAIPRSTVSTVTII